MGLDTFAYTALKGPDGTRNPIDAEEFRSDPAIIQNTVFDGHSFRGKIYAELVETATGQSLYQEEIPPVTVGTMAADLAAWVIKHRLNKTTLNQFGVTTAELDALAAWFKVVSNNGGIVVGWW